MNKFELYWRDLNIGSIVKTYFDMRDFGIISYKFDYLAEPSENKHLADFIKHSIRSSILIEEGDEEENAESAEIEEREFLDLINTTDWYLINEKGERKIILCPMFHEDDGITWMIDMKAAQS
ncbi:hypothetical protein [Flavobacterium fluviale]|uniref:Uncharacterized protein n=1 Tax=Flavobacterium fluviale TaxID=2249356 RepID=A0A344LVQ0_9FLAO|nr:hypothetical protein [Flavobacterium fluviale]AXB57992.1 hypothetical protein HYN86_15885 [Flavobacterium fluviale]